MANQLFPVFQVPKPDTLTQAYEQRFLPAPMFDYETGDFVRDGANRVVWVDGREAFMLWTRKMLSTQLGSKLCYLDQGVDFERCLAESNRAAIQSALERSITEALQKNPCTQRVYDFEYTWGVDTLAVKFTVKPHNWPEFDINADIVV